MSTLPRPAREILYRLPEPMRHALIVQYRARKWRAAGILFVHIPKAAGTSINQALYGRSFGHVTAAEIRAYAPALLTELPSFAVTRNPWDRLLSAYRFARQRPGRPVAIRHSRRYAGPSFETFERFVEGWLVSQDMASIDYVFRPQARFVTGSSGQVLLDYIGRVEEMQAVRRFIEQELGRPVTIEHLNETPASEEYRSSYTPRLMNLVGDLYASDVSLFGYEF